MSSSSSGSDVRWLRRHASTPTSLTARGEGEIVRQPTGPEAHGFRPPERPPVGFRYPRTLLHLAAVGIVDLDPWRLLVGDERPPRASAMPVDGDLPDLVPFAVRRTDGLLAVLQDDGRVHLRDGERTVLRLRSVDDWLRSAIEDFLAHDSGAATPERSQPERHDDRAGPS